MSTEFTPFSIRTASGSYFPLLDPSETDVHLVDLVESLGNLNRWTGHYPAGLGVRTVLGHSLHVFEVAHRLHADGKPLSDCSEFARQVLAAAVLHDAHEAYVGDVSSPLKLAMRFLSASARQRGGPLDWDGPFDEIEHRAQAAVFEHFGIDHELADHSTVKTADRLVLGWEADQIFGPGTAAEWDLEVGPAPSIRTTPATTRTRFKSLVIALTGVGS